MTSHNKKSFSLHCVCSFIHDSELRTSCYDSGMFRNSSSGNDFPGPFLDKTGKFFFSKTFKFRYRWVALMQFLKWKLGSANWFFRLMRESRRTGLIWNVLNVRLLSPSRLYFDTTLLSCFISNRCPTHSVLFSE